MRYRLGFALSVVLLAASCTTASDTPATAPPADPTPSQPLPIVHSPSTSAGASTTEQTDIDRRAAIEETFTNLEALRLTALYSADRGAITDIYAPSPYLDRTLDALEDFAGPIPQLEYAVHDILRNDNECLAFTYTARDLAAGTESALLTVILENNDSTYRYLFVTPGVSTWLCDGPHPLDDGD